MGASVKFVNGGFLNNDRIVVGNFYIVTGIGQRHNVSILYFIIVYKFTQITSYEGYILTLTSCYI